MSRLAALALVCGVLLSAGPSGLHAEPTVPAAVEQDEKGLWIQSEEEQKKINRSGLVYEDANIEAYLNTVLKRLVPADMNPDINPKVRVIKNHYLNAFTYPNGTMYIHSAMLARMDNEAQLAIVLGHEITHSVRRHAIKGYRNKKSKSSMLAVVSVVGAWGGIPVLLGAVGTMAAVSGYSRELETEADLEGLKLMVNAGYDPNEAVALFSRLEEEAKAEKTKQPFFFGTHPKLQERRENCQEFVKANATQTGARNEERFLAEIKNLVFDNCRLDLKAGRFRAARTGIEKYMRIQPEDPRGHYLLGELFRQKGEEGDNEKAKESYRKAISLDPSYGEPHKAMGLIFLKSKQPDLAKEHFKQYIRLSPQAPDRGYFEEYVKGSQ